MAAYQFVESSRDTLRRLFRPISVAVSFSAVCIVARRYPAQTRPDRQGPVLPVPIRSAGPYPLPSAGRPASKKRHTLIVFRDDLYDRWRAIRLDQRYWTDGCSRKFDASSLCKSAVRLVCGVGRKTDGRPADRPRGSLVALPTSYPSVIGRPSV